ncbi:hypothetical protein [Streptomyces sp. GQFP]|uniref:hypothetical protein n=1 Tax=Streptomyces sp. GQFP TaxID=2907545 RepID=UPI001F2851C9|nr:hypothetical protein [Streptomyces sp. GQFP]UIX32501.1 hypothetical protein LUX31_22055 [Streptomyces sp. GQFP]
MNDDELLAHLKATDPALTSKAPRPDVPRLVEATMSTSTSTKATAAKSPVRGVPRRRLVPAMAFTALLLAVGGGVTWGVAQGGEGTADKAGAGAAAEGGQVPGLQPQTLILADGDSAAVKCVAPTPDSLRRHDLAFEGTVTAEQGDLVVLRVDHWYRLDPNLANPSHEVRLSSDNGNSEAPDFPLGAHYLVTADSINGIVPICGGTTEATDEARAMFREAFEK